MRAVILVTVLFVALSTITFAIGMTSGSMFSCPLMTEHAVVCPMTAVDHVTGWKLLVAAVQEYSFVTILFVAIILYWLNFRRVTPDSLPSPQRYRGSTIIYQLHHYLLDAFSSGVIHPKIYAYIS